jgi:hypothetical protein
MINQWGWRPVPFARANPALEPTAAKSANGDAICAVKPHFCDCHHIASAFL